MKILFCLFFAIIYCNLNSVLAQSDVVALTFSILDSLNHPVEGALITIETENGTGLAFASSENEGNATIAFGATEFGSDLRIKISSYNFKTIFIPLEKGKTHYTVQLENLDNVLAEVVVKGRKKPRIVSAGDTLSYGVNDFKSQADRTIADVIRRLPGIEVNANGMIYFRGRPISNFYIEGDDLLGSKYTLASENIKADIVDSIQVIDDNQPIRVLQGIEAGTNPAINLRLKNNAGFTWIKNIEAGIGIPFSYNAVASAMAFKPEFKTLNLLKSNNAGTGYAFDMASIAVDNSQKWIEKNFSQDFLSTGNFYYPKLEISRWLFNNSTMASTNTLFKGKEHSSFKVNAHVLNETQTTAYSSIFSNYGLNDSISYTESAKENTNIKLAEVNLNYNANRRKIFIDEKLNLQIKSSNAHSNLISEAKPILQELQQPDFHLSNSFSSVQLLKNRIISRFFSTIDFDNQPEYLTIFPGVLPQIINNGINYSSTKQNLTYTNFSTTNAFAIKLFTGIIYHSYLAGLSYDRQQIKSSLNGIAEDGSTLAIDQDFYGQLLLNKFRPFLFSDWGIRNDKHDFSASLYFKAPFINYDIESKDETFRKFIPSVNPTVRYKIKMGIENSMVLHYSLNHFEGNVQDIYAPAVLRDYRTIISKDLPFYTRKEQAVAARLNLQNSLKILFANFSVNYSQLKMNYITAHVYSPESTILTAIPHDNIISQVKLSAGFSKYLFAIKTNVELKGATGFSRTSRLQDSTFFPVKNQNQTYEFILRKKIGSIISAGYKMSLQTNKAIIESSIEKNTKNAWTLQHQMTVDVFPISNLRFNLLFQSKANKIDQTISSRFYTVDASASYLFEDPKIEISLKGTNLTGLKNYQEFYFSENSLFLTDFSIRPMTVMLSCSLNF